MATRFSRSWLYALTLAGVTAGSLEAGTLSINKNVDSQAGPWNQAVNSAFDYGAHDNIAPTVYSASDGYSFNGGDTLTITYVSGLTSAFGGVPPTVDGKGYVGGVFKNDDLGSSGNGLPSKYMGPYPPDIFLNALVGTFTNSSGVIVGTPFAVDDGPLAVTIPVGATRLQLGVNDDVFSDNTGALVVNVAGSAAAVPEPATLSLLGLGTLCMAGYRWRRRMLAA
jgi:hypothetical protein